MNQCPSVLGAIFILSTKGEYIVLSFRRRQTVALTDVSPISLYNGIIYSCVHDERQIIGARTCSAITRHPNPNRTVRDNDYGISNTQIIYNNNPRCYDMVLLW